MRTLSITLALLFSVVAANQVAAQAQEAAAQCQVASANVPRSAELAVPVLQRLSILDCLGGSQDVEPIAKTIRALTATDLKADATVAERRAAVALSLQRLSDYARTPPTARLTGAQVLSDRLAQASLALGTASPLVQPETWEFDAGGLGAVAPDLTRITAGLDDACKDGATQCEATFTAILGVSRVARLAHDALLRAESTAIHEFVRQASIRQARWDAYFDDAPSQYWWELQINSRRLADDRLTIDSVRQGFRSVPSSQIVLLHPSTAMEWAPDEPNGKSYGAVVTVAVLGGNWWRYRDDGGIGRGIGVAAVVSWRDRVNMKDLAYGGALTINQKYTIGVTTDGSRVSALVSTDVAKLWNKVSPAKRASISLVK